MSQSVNYYIIITVDMYHKNDNDHFYFEKKNNCVIDLNNTIISFVHFLR